MKKRNKLALLLGTATMALTGCTEYNSTMSEYQSKLNNLAEQIKVDMKEVGLDIYGYRFVNRWQAWRENGYNNSRGFDYIASNGNNGDFLSFVNGIITNDVTSGEQYSLVVYSISDKDYEYISNYPKTTEIASQTERIVYTGEIEAVQYVIGNETSKLYSVKNLTTDTVLYSVENQNEMTDNGMEM